LKIGFSALGFGVNDNLGGSVIVASTNAIQLASRGHEVIYFCTNKKDKSSNLFNETTIKKIKGVKVIYLKTYLFPSKGSFGLHLIPEIKKFLEKESFFDVFHLNEYRSYTSLFISKWCSRNKIPFIIQPQGTLIKGGKSLMIKWLFDHLFTARILKKAAAIIAVTNREKLLAQELGIKESKIRVIPTGINLGDYESIPLKGAFRKKEKIEDDSPIVLFVGRLDQIKGVDILISAFAKIEIPKCKLVIIGPNHGSSDEIAKQIKDLRLSESVLLAGALPEYKDVLSAINDADILVVPSRAEAFGMVILEGSVLKKAMVISKNCNVSDFYVDAAKVVSLSIEEVANAITHLLSNPKLRLKLGSQAREVVENNFKLDKVVLQIEKLYLNIITKDK